MANSTDDWARIEAIFAAALEVEGSARSALVAARCAGHPELRAEVESLLQAHEAPTSIELQNISNLARVLDVRLGTIIGGFRLIEPIGKGGMSTVYRGERVDAGFSHQAAVKLIAVPVGDPTVGRRFQAERQILASLQHPHVVTLLDGGVTSDGFGYLVMEYIEGTPIAAYCRERGLPLDARLRLFRQVCSAVHHAHRHFVVHRDLKPGNILITAEGEVKVLDFGIAKLLADPAAAAATTANPLGLGPLTPNYASPEQLRGLPVTTSSDIYALGVLLYELLTGSRPYETTGRTLDEVLQLVMDAAPPKPSAALRGPDAALPYDPHRALKGDLDAVILRALSKEPERRYGSAEELSDDLGRYIEGKPVVAREPSLGYIVRKLAARHTVPAISIGVSTALVLAALVVAIWQARVATIERGRAEQRFNDVRRLANALVFDIHDSVAPLAGSTPVRQKIVREALQYLQRLAPEVRDDPTLQIELGRAYVQIGKVQGVPGVSNLGDRRGAIDSLTNARLILAPLAAMPSATVDTVSHYVEATRHLSSVLLFDGQRDRAAAVAREAFDAAEACALRHPGDDKALSLLGRSSFAWALTSARPDALPLWNKAADVYETLLSARPDDPERQRNVALVAKYLGDYHSADNDHQQALKYRRRALELDEKRLALDPASRSVRFDVGNSLAGVANSVWNLEDVTGAIELYERSLQVRAGLAKSDPADVLARSRLAFAHSQLGNAYWVAGDKPRAEANLRAAIATHQSIAQTDPYTRKDLAQAFWWLADLETDRGREREACAAYAEAFTVLRDVPESVRLREKNRDPVVDLGQRAARCGMAAAQQWLASRP